MSYIEREAAICIADYAVDEHPHEKNPKKPETFSAYNEGWNDACDYIRSRLETEQCADVAPVRHGRWVHDHYENCSEQFEIVKCTNCGHKAYAMAIYVRGGNYCPNCGAKMGG